jgi:glycosyltransferase involved in cell wall biosynthesis
MDCKVSIIIPYNIDRGFLKAAIASCEDQDDFTLGVDYEIITQQGDYFVSKNVNDAIAKAQGKYIKKCDEDDMLTPNCLIDLYTFAEEGGYDFVCANAVHFGDENNTISSMIPETVGELADLKSIHISSGLFLRSAMLEVNEEMWTAEDFDLILRMASGGCKFGYLDAVVYMYRVWGLNKSRDFNTVPNARKGSKFRYEFVQELQDKYMTNEYYNMRIKR